MNMKNVLQLSSIILILSLLCLGCACGAEQVDTPSPIPQATQAAPVEDDVVIVPGETNAPIQTK